MLIKKKTIIKLQISFVSTMVAIFPKHLMVLLPLSTTALWSAHLHTQYTKNKTNLTLAKSDNFKI